MKNLSARLIGLLAMLGLLAACSNNSSSGGVYNTASGLLSSISGGQNNTATHNYSSILGGNGQASSTQDQTIPALP